MATRDIYTKATHFVLLKEALPEGRIVLTTEQEATLPAILPHVFETEIQQDRFVWLMMAFDKKATKSDHLRKVKAYKQDRWRFRNEALYDNRFDLDTDAQTITETFIADHIRPATRPGKTVRPFPISNFVGQAFPKLWVHSPTQASGELDKVVGFLIVPMQLRQRLKRVPFDCGAAPADLREDLAPWAYRATLQPVSTFMNSVRERLSAADRTSSGGARMSGTHIQGAIFNPKTLVSLLNIFRVATTSSSPAEAGNVGRL